MTRRATGRALPLLAGAVALAALAVVPAQALERHGSTTIELPGGKGPAAHDFRTSHDPATGAVARQGTVRLASGRTVAYDAKGRCDAGAKSCTWVGTGVGPFGGTWTMAGSFRQEADGSNRLEQTMTAPTGQKIVLRHQPPGDRFPLPVQ